MTTPVDGSATTEPTVPGGTGTTTTVTGNTANTVFTSPVSMTREELDRQLAEARRTGERTAKESEEIKALRAKAKRADELEEATKSETEKLADRAAKAEALAAENATKYRSALIESAFTTAAITANIPADRVKSALKLADMTGVDVGEDGTVSGMDKAIKSLPDWLAAPVADTTKQGSGIPSTPKPDNGTRAMTEAEEARRQAYAAQQVRSRF